MLSKEFKIPYSAVNKYRMLQERLFNLEEQERDRLLSGDNDDVIEAFYDKADQTTIREFNAYLIRLMNTNKTLLNHYLEPYLEKLIADNAAKKLDEYENDYDSYDPSSPF